MTTPITVFVNDQPVKIFQGMQVKHALIACNEALYRAAQAGDLQVVDRHGFQVGLEGAVQEGTHIFTRSKSG